MTNESRYEGKPLLRLLECYVLWAIGKLQPKDVVNLETLTPKLNEVYGRSGPWQIVIQTTMEIPDDAAGKMRLLWGKYSEQAALKGHVLDPEEFTRQFVDQNFGLS